MTSEPDKKKPIWRRYFLWGMPVAGIAAAFVGGDFLDTVETESKQQSITEECTVIRAITTEK